MRAITRALVFGACIAQLLASPGPTRGVEPTVKPACPSLDGDWFGEFDGAFAGTWYATFTQAGPNVQAQADITVDSGKPLEAQGSAGVKCDGGKTTIAGTGAARGKSGSFSGVSDETGKHLSGTWWRGDLFGTWRGERTTGEP